MNTVVRNEKKHAWLHISIIIIATSIAYFKIVHAPFSIWDDGERVINNPDIRGISWHNISAWFSHFYVSDYQPLSMVSYAIDFLIGKQQPFIYHFTNITLHIFNAIVLYLLVIKIQKNAVV